MFDIRSPISTVPNLLFSWIGILNASYAYLYNSFENAYHIVNLLCIVFFVY